MLENDKSIESIWIGVFNIKSTMWCLQNIKQ